MKKGSKKIIGILVALLIVAALVFGFVKGYISLEDGGKIHFDFDPKPNTNTVEPANNTVPGNSSGNTNTVPGNSSGNTNTVPANTANTVEPDINTNTAEPDDGAANTVTPDNSAANTPVYYSSADLKKLKGTEVFSSSAIEHIFIGSVNSSKKGSGYHYDMISDSKGEIVDGTRSKDDPNGIYTADVTVDGYRKDHYSTFYPDSWSPQQIVDAIVQARKEALANNQRRGSYWYGHGGGIRIEMYLDSKNKVVTAYPIYNGK